MTIDMTRFVAHGPSMTSIRFESSVDLRSCSLKGRVAVGACICLFLLGCRQEDASSDGDITRLPYSGVQLNLVIPATLGLSDQWAPAVNDWARENEASVEIIEVDFGDDPSDWISQLRESPTSLIVMPTTQLGEFVGAELAATIPAALIETDVIAWHQIAPSVRSTLDQVGEDPAFMTMDCPIPVVAVRGDLLEAAGRSLPTTWSEYDQLVTEVSEWAPNHLAVEPRADAFLPTLFLARAISGACHPAGLSVELDVSDGTPLIASPPYVRALTEMQNLSPHLAGDVRSMSPTDCLSALSDGHAAIGIIWDSDEASLTNEQTPSTGAGNTVLPEHGRLLFTPLPGRQEVYNRDERAWEPPPDGDVYRPSLCGFSGLSVAVTKSSDDEASQAAAWDLWSLLFAYQVDGTIPGLPASSPTTDLSTSRPTVARLTSEENADYFELQSAQQQNRWLIAELPIAGRMPLRKVLGAAIARALDDNVNASAALEEAQTEWSTVIDEIGRTKVLNSDRVRRGLVPVAK